MPHPQMFDDDDPFLARVREIALGFPDSDEKISHGRPAFFTTKVFAIYGGSVKVEGAWVQHPQSLMVFPDPDELRALRDDPRFYVPGYWGPWGWLAMHLDKGTDWQEVTELLEDSYRATARPRSIAKLDSAT